MSRILPRASTGQKQNRMDYPSRGILPYCLPLTSSGTEAGGVQPVSDHIIKGSESGQLSARGFEPTQTPTAA